MALKAGPEKVAVFSSLRSYIFQSAVTHKNLAKAPGCCNRRKRILGFVDSGRSSTYQPATTKAAMAATTRFQFHDPMTAI